MPWIGYLQSPVGYHDAGTADTYEQAIELARRVVVPPGEYAHQVAYCARRDDEGPPDMDRRDEIAGPITKKKGAALKDFQRAQYWAAGVGHARGATD